LARRSSDAGLVTSIITLGGRVGRVGGAVRSLVDQFIVLRPLPLLSMVLPLGLARAIRRTRPNVVHLHSGAWYKSALAARLARAPRVIYTEHGREHDDPPLQRTLDRWAARWTDVVVPVSDRLGSYLANVVGVEAKRLHTIPNGVDTHRYTPGFRNQALLDQLQIPPDALIVGSLGRLERVKRYDRLVEVLACLPREIGGRTLHLLLCGDGSERAGLLQLAERRGVAERVRLPGWMADPPGAHRLLDVFALTSESEGMSVSLLEAMASGVAPVVMDVGANAELVGPGLTGQVVKAGDVAAFAEVTAQTLREVAHRAHIGRAARARVVERYAFARMLAQYERIYRGTESGPRGSCAPTASSPGSGVAE
jgi:glycosyltransferase involved in cell wall biosynthesis